MTGMFRTSAEEMAAASKHVLDVNSQLQQQLASLRAQLSTLDATWDGPAKNAFSDLMAQWDQDARKINDNLRGIGEQIGASGTTYSQQDQAVSDSVSTISRTLG